MSDPHKPKVFCLGLSRTGTTSISERLSLLGYKTIHYSLGTYLDMHNAKPETRLASIKRNGKYWLWALKREMRAQRTLRYSDTLESYDAFADLPFPLIYREISATFPTAKFILTSRETDSWLASMKWLLTDGKVLWNQGLLDECLLYEAYGTHIYQPDVLIDRYNKHNEEVRKHFHGSGRLLDLNIDEGDIESPKIEDFLEINRIDLPAKRHNERIKIPFHKRLIYRLKHSSRTLHYASIVAKRVLSKGKIIQNSRGIPQ